MGQNATSKLTAEQLNCIDLLVTGLTDQVVADTIGVSRTSIWRWKQERQFEAALDARRKELWAGCQDRLRALLPRALDVLEEALEGGGKSALRAALKVVDVAGLGKAGLWKRARNEPRFIPPRVEPGIWELLGGNGDED